MKKIYILRAVSIILLLASILIIVISKTMKNESTAKYDDGVEIVDPNTIILSNSGVRVSFSDVILSKPAETRKLVVFEQEGTVSYKIEDRMFDFLDWEPSKKYQTVQYTGKGSFVIELDQLDKSNIVEDAQNHTVTIKIPHPVLDTIEIDPNKVEIGDKQSGFFAIGDIKLTLSDYNKIEKELRKRLQAKFDDYNNGQQADDLALKAVYDIYNPLVKAVDSDYELKVEWT
ncbi:MAG: DUF4230 domain-containing protein [Pseudobutyrivibrio sp.]|nr:DUF4230 domain-containing protein [Pseudobutyrivibrio sp.]